MKKFLLTLVSCIPGYLALAQSDISAMEYYVDTDPGIGLATDVTVSSGQEIDLTFTVPISSMGLTTGFHLLVVRTQNVDGDWSLHEKRPFYIQESAGLPPPVIEDIASLEYFIDDDPGVGVATSVVVTPGQNIDINELIDVSSITDGFHSIGVRVKNAADRWGFTERKIFFIQNTTSIGSTPADIVALEYFFDDDPGHGSAAAITITQGQAIDINALAAASSLSAGFHTISVRAQNSDGRWGLSETRVLYIQNTGSGPVQFALITAIEYYIDEDPGVGLGFQVPISPSMETVDIMSIALSTGGGLSIGDHTLTIRAQNENGLWGHKETTTFSVDGDCPIAGFDLAQACAGEDFQLTDTSSGILGAVDYRWYADGVLVSNIEGDITHAFENPGTHTLSLAIENDVLCTDSTGVIVEVKLKPIVVFNVENVEPGAPSVFLTDQFNLDPTSTWEWDFDTDGNVDDTTPGNTNFIFAGAGSYLTTLTVTDALGCGTSFSRTVSVGGGGPKALFESSDICLGGSSEFIDLSTGIPVDAAYSWDLDGDGNEDATTEGNVTYTYDSEGTYNATLSITTTDNVLFVFSKLITVILEPSADFTAGASCVGEPVLMTDQSMNADTYSWDFDGDGIVDSQIAGDVSFTYTEPGTYLASLLVDNGGGCFDFKAVNVQVDSSPTAEFEFVHTTSGTSATVTFENKSVNGTEYLWDFGDGNTSTEANPTHTFEDFAGTTFEICLSAINECIVDQSCISVGLTAVLGLASLGEVGIGLYPNPSHGTVHLDFRNTPTDIYQIMIYDLTGKLVFNETQNTKLSTQFKKQNLPAGSFLLTITSPSFSTQQKLVVK
ncbi:MAG: PKD domain-containing protein [Cyclobacteriaceae bacterium]